MAFNNIFIFKWERESDDYVTKSLLEDFNIEDLQNWTVYIIIALPRVYSHNIH